MFKLYLWVQSFCIYLRNVLPGFASMCLSRPFPINPRALPKTGIIDDLLAFHFKILVIWFLFWRSSKLHQLHQWYLWVIGLFTSIRCNQDCHMSVGRYSHNKCCAAISSWSITLWEEIHGHSRPTDTRYNHIFNVQIKQLFMRCRIRYHCLINEISTRLTTFIFLLIW